MGLAIVAVVFVAGLIGIPTLFTHEAAHAPAQQVASAQTPAPGVNNPEAPDTSDTRSSEAAATEQP
ncbi:hypothetical protein PUN4_100009 [Paraburkholderia unamae]|uniref:hypothetical protein n=1 Tax=Paraburkholderia unamae TaxID=219649 RepID=UPI001CB1C140|nr:hypothetical protein [Paraburkholderia unamae]CAG9243861.1 hypothetical protein PUN4_100009 [Paraburkholderia unamae]